MAWCCDRWRCSIDGGQEGLIGDGPAELAESEYRVTVDGFDIVQRGRHVVYRLTVHRGRAHWPLRRRYRQFLALHKQLLQSLGRSTERLRLPRPPPKWTCRSFWSGQQDRRFLTARASALQHYLASLLRFIPFVDQSETLRGFLCSVDINSMNYDALVDLGQALGRGDDFVPQGLEAAEIEALPKRSSLPAAQSGHSPRCAVCVICQEVMLPDEDVRVLPCRHEYHFVCISQWLSQSKACCICQQLAAGCRPPDDSGK